MLNKHN